MELSVTKNFDWSVTNRKLCIFIPNFGKKELLEFSISQIKTSVPKEDWVIIIGNDGIPINFDHLKSQNVHYFNLNRTPVEERNGAFIRNYAIKRSQSEIFFQKDPEVVLQGDFIKKVCAVEGLWRPGNIYVLDRGLTAELLVEKDFSILKYSACMKMDPVKVLDADFVKYAIIAENGKRTFSSYFHYAYAAPTKVLVKMRGYDERYLYYGYEDSDIFCRLLHDKHFIIPDYDITAIHLFHERHLDILNLKRMCKIFTSQNPSNVSRNEIWGEGG